MTKLTKRFRFAVLFDGAGGCKELVPDEVEKWSESDGLLWIDCDQTSQETRHWLEYESGASEAIANILLAGETRPRTVVQPNGLVVILRGINMNPGAVPDDMVAVRIWLQKNRIITSHRRSMFSIDDIRNSLLAGDGPRTAGEFLVALTGFLSGRIGASIDNIEQLIDDIDSQILSGAVGDLRTTLGVVRRQAAAIRRHLTPQRDALDRLSRADSDILTSAEVHDIREAGDHVMRQLEDLDLARENAFVTQEELMNRIAQEQNARMYLLSIVSAVFLPLMFVTGLLGMNVAGLPGTSDPNGFLYAIVIMVIFGTGMAIYFKLKKWI